MKGYLLLITILSSLFCACEDAIDTNPKYQRPEGLEGKIYDVCTSIEEISTFVTCLEKTGLDVLVNNSGLYTVLAPSNEAFAEYISSNTEFANIDDVDNETLKGLIERHIVVMPYSVEQLKTLDVGGWIEDDDEDTRYWAFKKETLHRPKNLTLQVTEEEGQRAVIDPQGNSNRTIYSSTNKYAPFFYKEYLDYIKINSSDIEYYYPRNGFEASEIYYGGGKLLETKNQAGEFTVGTPAENGYVYVIDKVLENLDNGYAHLLNQEPSRPQYNQFTSLVNEFGIFSFNQQATNNQAGASQGLEVEKLYDLDFPTLAFNPHEEATSNLESFNIVTHNALFAPKNDAYNTFIQQICPNTAGYYTSASLPVSLKRMIVNSHMISGSPFYPSLSQNSSTVDANNDNVDLSNANAIDKQFGSNCTFVGLDRVLMPQLLKSVVGPVALRNTYSTYFWALYATGAFDIAKIPTVDYTLFPISNSCFEMDSTLIAYGSDPVDSKAKWNFRIYDRMDKAYVGLPIKSQEVDELSLTNLVYHHIGIGTHLGNCRKEFIRNLNGYYITVNNENNTISGGYKATAGYNGGDEIDLMLDDELSNDLGDYGFIPQNGRTYGVKGWLNFEKNRFTVPLVNSLGSDFVTLMERVGAIVSDDFTILKEGEIMTVFIPSNAAIQAAQIDTLSDEKLREVLEAHFVVGTTMFTDNVNKNPHATRYFTKAGKRITLSSTASDQIEILNNTGDVFYSFTESPQTNKMFIGWDNGNEDDGNQFLGKELAGITVVAHVIDAVIIPESVLEN